MAISNVSSNEKTVKNMFMLLSNDNYKIDNTLFYCCYERNDIQVELGNVLDSYRDYFEKDLITMDVPEKFYYQPAAFAENYYGTPDLDFLVLYFAKMTSLIEFKRPKIKVLKKEKIVEINRLFVEYRTRVKESYDNPTKYTSDTYLKTY